MSENQGEPKVSETVPAPRPATDPARLALLALLTLAIGWASWTALLDMETTWSDDTRYSHGFLVPLFSLFLLWHRKDLFGAGKGSWLCLPFLIAGALLKVAGARYFLTWFDAISLLPTLAGVCLALGGLPALRWAWPSIAFLFFMVPLPYRIENAVGPPLQRTATLASTYILQTIGLPAQDEGNVINLEGVKIGVIEACNGLGMLMMFFAYATAVAILIRRPLVDRIVIILSAAPIAMIANIFRISLTGFLHTVATRAVADHFYHDLAGWLMMPIALALFGAELFLLSKLFIEVKEADRPGSSPVDRISARPGAPLLIDVRSISRDRRKGR